MTTVNTTASYQFNALSRRAATVCEAVSISMLALLAARLLWFVLYGASVSQIDIEPLSPLDVAAAPVAVDASSLRRGKLFEARGAQSEVETLPETQLDLTLRGVRRGARAGTGSAVIEAPGQGQRTLPLGAEIVGGVTIEAIHTERVVINRRGVRENLFLREEARQRAEAAAAGAGDPPEGRGEASADPQAAAPTLSADSGADWIRALRLSRTDGGYRIGEAADADMLSALSLRSGDVITAVNNRPLTQNARALDLFEDLEDVDGASLTVSRDGRAVEIEVELR